MTNILVPTDFTPASLTLAEQAIKEAGDHNMNIILFHAFELPSSAFDMLEQGYKAPAHELMNEAFRRACAKLKADQGKLVSKIIVRCMNGNSTALFRNFAEANDIDLIYFPENYSYNKIHSRSIDPKTFFKKSGIPVLKQANKARFPVFSNPQFVQSVQPAA